MTSSPVCRTAWAEEENRRASPRNAQITAAMSGPTPNSCCCRVLQPIWRRENAAIWRAPASSSASRPPCAAARPRRPAPRPATGPPPGTGGRGPDLRWTAARPGRGRPGGTAWHGCAETSGVLLAQVAVYSCSSARSSQHLLRRDPRHRAPSRRRPGARRCRESVLSVLACCFGPRRCAVSAGSASSAVIPARCSSCTTNSHPVQPSTAKGHIVAAGEPVLQPPAAELPAAGSIPAPPHLPGHGVQIVEGDLLPMNVKPSYDAHYRDLLTLLKLGQGPCSLSPYVVDTATTDAGEVPPHMASLGRSGTRSVVVAVMRPSQWWSIRRPGCQGA